ncbi:MAG: hypothetical protein ACRETD_02480 [Steroidobacteraceae bacterium]
MIANVYVREPASMNLPEAQPFCAIADAAAVIPNTATTAAAIPDAVATVQ